MKHLIDPTDLSKQETDEIIALAEDIIAHREKYQDRMAHRKLATLFYEPSTRTRLSFTSAMLELGGTVLGFSDAKNSSVSKGETVQDTIRVVGCFADIIAMRHPIEGAPLAASEVARVPIINAVAYKETDDLDSAIPGLDVLYMTRVQKERFLDEEEFERVKDSFVLDCRRMALGKPTMAVLHPLPRVNEILTEVDDDPRAAYFRQVENGKFVRMALICKLLEWKDDPSHAMPASEGCISDEGLRCSNVKCICNNENVKPKFRVSEGGAVRCRYCDSKVK